MGEFGQSEFDAGLNRVIRSNLESYQACLSSLNVAEFAAESKEGIDSNISSYVSKKFNQLRSNVEEYHKEASVGASEENRKAFRELTAVRLGDAEREYPTLAKSLAKRVYKEMGLSGQ